MNFDDPQNLILRSLSEGVRTAVMAAAEPVHFNLRERACEPNSDCKYVDFIESGVMSLLTVMDDGTLVELATIGREGMLGVSVALGVSSIAELVICQVEASAWRVPVAVFQRLLSEHQELVAICGHFGMALFENVSINTGCNRLHPVEKRCARWMLLTHDRCDSDSFTLTQEFLATMLGVSRTSVNFAAGLLLKARVISYTRGKVTVLDRDKLEVISCACYKGMNECYKKIMGFEPTNSVALAS